MTAPDKMYMPNELLSEEWQRHIEGEDTAYIRKDMVVAAIKLAYGTVSMNPFDCSKAFEELLNTVG